VLRRRVLHIKRHVDQPEEGLLDRVDAVLFSHAHADHLDPASLRRVDRRARVIAPPGARGPLRRGGHDEITHVVPGDSVRVGSLEITATPAVHDGRRWPIGGPKPAVGYVIAGSKRLYFAGDTDLFEGMHELGDAGLDVAFLPVGGWGPKVGTGHLDPRRAAEAAAVLRPRVVVPIHWGTYLSLGTRRGAARLLREPPRRFERELAEHAPGVEAKTLAPGEWFELAG
jgi:L-ascorbate metabolism protein UlaG (beta-lactamase superfamily)